MNSVFYHQTNVKLQDSCITMNVWVNEKYSDHHQFETLYYRKLTGKCSTVDSIHRISVIIHHDYKLFIS